MLKLRLSAALVFISTTISLTVVSCQTPSALQILTHPRPDLAGEDDYIDEIAHGHRVRDVDKFTRQKDCMCLKHLKDPHCGNDGKVYDNGCFFLCAQQREKGLRLKRWGNCDEPTDDDFDDYDVEDTTVRTRMLAEPDADFVDEVAGPAGFVES